MTLTVDEYLLARIIATAGPCAPGPESYEDVERPWSDKPRAVQRAYVAQARRYITMLGRVTGQHKSDGGG